MHAPAGVIKRMSNGWQGVASTCATGGSAFRAHGIRFWSVARGECTVLDVAPLLRSSATLELDSRRPFSELADEVERLMTSNLK